MLPPLVAVGGVGGSGTRLVAKLLQAAGFHLGDDLNESCDTLWFTLLFKRIEILRADRAHFDRLTDLLVAALGRGQPIGPEDRALLRQLAAQDRPQHPAAWLRERAETMVAAAAGPPIVAPLAWKEPNTHVVIERLWQSLPGLRYVHVVRNGIAMAYSSNQNQLRLWGRFVLGQDGPVTPARSLAYWCRVHQRMQRIVSDNPARTYWLDYDRLCREPDAEAGKLCRFLGCDPRRLAQAMGLVRVPSKRDGIDLGEFARSDLEYVRSLGYTLD